MEKTNIELKFCSLFPDIDYSENVIHCTLRPYLLEPEITKIIADGSYERLNKRGQIGGHVAEAYIKRRYSIDIFHTQSFDLSFLSVSDYIKITDADSIDYIFYEVVLESQILIQNVYKTTIVGSFSDKKSFASNLTSGFVKLKNEFDSDNKINTIICFNRKPSYYLDVPILTNTGGYTVITVPITADLNNIVINDYLYCHSDISVVDFGIAVVKCTAKTVTTITFTAVDFPLIESTETNVKLVLNFEPSFEENILVVPRSLSTLIYTDFIERSEIVSVATDKEITTGLGSTFEMQKNIKEKINVPFFLSSAEYYKFFNALKSENVGFFSQTKLYKSADTQGIFTEIKKDGYFETHEFLLSLTNVSEIINLNK